MVIASNEWLNYDDVKKQKQSQIIETTTTMAAPSSLPPSSVSISTNPNITLGTLTSVVGNNAHSTTTTTTTINNLNDSSSSSSSSFSSTNSTTIHDSSNNTDEPGCDSNVARMVLVCQPDSHPFQTRTIYLTPNVECKVGRSIAKSKSSENNAVFDCKVLSRTHAVLWYSNDEKFYVKDTKSSNGTYINERKINAFEPVELNFGDVLKFGVEVIENSRKEVHGCIIASVKPYLPDGREAISITQDSPFRGDSRISFEELHRLNLYMQETSQREKLLKAKLQNIQNILDATRKNSKVCWQSMIDEDRLLNRIDLLENKLQFLQKNSPVDQLKDEILKLQEEKFVYQNSAKEALSKVYQERMEAMQKLSKVERDFTCSENECSLLRDQIRYTKQNLQDVNTRLLSLEKEYNDYKEQVEKCQRETKEEQTNFDAAVNELATKLKESEIECDGYKKKIGQLLIQRSEELDAEDQKRKEKYAEEETVVDAIVAAVKANDTSSTSSSNTTTTAQQPDNNISDDSDDNNDNNDKLSNHDNTNNKKSNSAAANNKSTIMKWLENSDLNSKEGSLHIMQAICNESDSSDESENEVEKSSICTTNTITATNMSNSNSNSNSATATPTPIMSSEQIYNKLHLVDKNLNQLEAELRSKHATAIDVGVENGIQQLENASYQLLNYTVSLLRDTYSEMCKQDGQTNLSVVGGGIVKQETLVNQNENDDEEDENDDNYNNEEENKDKQYKTDIVRQKQQAVEYQNEIQKLKQQLESQESINSNTLKSLQSEWESSKERISHLTELIENLTEKNEALELEIVEYKSKSTKLQVDNDVNDDDDDDDDKKQQTETNFSTVELLNSSSSSDLSSTSLDKLIEEEKFAMNNAAIINEEELILYKERFGQTQAENLKLKREIAELKLKFDDLTATIFRKSLIYVTVVVALIVYFIFSYI